MPKPMPELLRCPLCPKVKPAIGIQHFYMPYDKRKPQCCVMAMSRDATSIWTKYYKTERGARLAWNRLMLKMGGK